MLLENPNINIIQKKRYPYNSDLKFKALQDANGPNFKGNQSTFNIEFTPPIQKEKNKKSNNELLKKLLIGSLAIASATIAGMLLYKKGQKPKSGNDFNHKAEEVSIDQEQLKKIRQNLAIETIKKYWKGFKARQEEEKAARTIQKHWKGFNLRKKILDRIEQIPFALRLPEIPPDINIKYEGKPIVIESEALKQSWENYLNQVLGESQPKPFVDNYIREQKKLNGWIGNEYYELKEGLLTKWNKNTNTWNILNENTKNFEPAPWLTRKPKEPQPRQEEISSNNSPRPSSPRLNAATLEEIERIKKLNYYGEVGNHITLTDPTSGGIWNAPKKQKNNWQYKDPDGVTWNWNSQTRELSSLNQDGNFYPWDKSRPFSVWRIEPISGSQYQIDVKPPYTPASWWMPGELIKITDPNKSGSVINWTAINLTTQTERNIYWQYKDPDGITWNWNSQTGELSSLNQDGNFYPWDKSKPFPVWRADPISGSQYQIDVNPPPTPSSKVNKALEALGLDPQSSFTSGQVTKAYRKQSLRLHPDKTEEQETFKVINDANEFLQSLLNPLS